VLTVSRQGTYLVRGGKETCLELGDRLWGWNRRLCSTMIDNIVMDRMVSGLAVGVRGVNSMNTRIQEPSMIFVCMNF
jgi:hypothetical protein